MEMDPNGDGQRGTFKNCKSPPVLIDGPEGPRMIIGPLTARPICHKLGFVHVLFGRAQHPERWGDIKDPLF
jgi:hypothetical protein